MSSANSPGGSSVPTADAQVAKIFEWRRGFNAIRLIDIGIHLGLFRALAATPSIDAPSPASQLELHSPYVKEWA